jgi:hypothetical protein
MEEEAEGGYYDTYRETKPPFSFMLKNTFP